jgi:hypothetical protein
VERRQAKYSSSAFSPSSLTIGAAFVAPDAIYKVRGLALLTDSDRPGRFAEQRDPPGIAAKRADVLLHPLQPAIVSRRP